MSSWVRHNDGFEYTFLLDGPAVAIFRRKLGAINILSSDSLTEKFVQTFDFVLTGTGWASKLEQAAVRACRASGVISASFLDHWCNYLSRFRHGSELVLPDEIWVGDKDAYQLAQSCFGTRAIRLVENPYFIDVEEEFSNYGVSPRDATDLRILYVCEAIAESGAMLLSGEFIEYRSLDLFLGHLKRITTGKEKTTIRLRPHPAEEPDKYAEYASRKGLFKVEIGDGLTLIEDCVWADCVVGMNSMALVIARIGGKRVFYCNLDGKKPKSLPTTGLENFLNIKSL